MNSMKIKKTLIKLLPYIIVGLVKGSLTDEQYEDKENPDQAPSV